MSYFVYILYSESIDKFYKGHTSDLDARILRHNHKYEKSTDSGAPWKLVWFTTKPDKSSAAILEIKLKNLSRRRLIQFIDKNSEGLIQEMSWVLTP